MRILGCTLPFGGVYPPKGDQALVGVQSIQFHAVVEPFGGVYPPKGDQALVGVQSIQFHAVVERTRGW